MNKIWIASVTAACVSATTTICQPAQATTYYFDAGVGGTSINAAGQNAVGIACFGCGYLSPLFVIPAGQYQPGDILDFGSVALFPGPIGYDQYGDVGFQYDYFDYSTTGPLPYYYDPGGTALEGELNVPGTFCSTIMNPTCEAGVQAAWNAKEASPIVMQLDFTVGTGELDIQMAWAYAGYSPPTTPLPAALPLFASGIGAVGLFGWRRKRKVAAQVAA